MLMQHPPSVAFSNSTYALDLCAGVRAAGCVEVDGKLYEVEGKVAVCCNDDGKRPQPQALSKWWSRHCKKYGCEAGRFTACATRFYVLLPPRACTRR
ncbi:hypothetical protein [Adlercreutzia sp. ZJ141]|uniref:hypothetical protein n=1 Tax=Adlercreutzia sp. ZJ141 TaxID=2709406 RepID=UPI0013ECA9F0|nr:hypothetical protein [Adlercreutzia sp. ZJ141]